MAHTCRECGLLKTEESREATVGGKPRAIATAVTPNCLLLHETRYAHEAACARFFPRVPGWGPEQHYELSATWRQASSQNRLALAALVISLLSLAVTLAQAWPAVRQLFP